MRTVILFGDRSLFGLTGSFGFLLQLILYLFPVAVLSVVTGEIFQVGITTEYQQMIDNLIHKVAVVRNNDHTTFKVTQIFFQHIQRYDIEVVGRLIQYKEVRITHQDCTQIKTALLSPTQFINIAMLFFGSKQEIIQELRNTQFLSVA